MRPPLASSSTRNHSHTHRKLVESRSPAGQATGCRPRARAHLRSPWVVPAAPAPPRPGQPFQGLRHSPVVPFRPVGAPGVASSRRRLHLRRPLLPVAARSAPRPMEFSRRGRAPDDGQRPPPHGNRRVTVTLTFSSLPPDRWPLFCLFQFSWVQMQALVRFQAKNSGTSTAGSGIPYNLY